MYIYCDRHEDTLRSWKLKIVSVIWTDKYLQEFFEKLPKFFSHNSFRNLSCQLLNNFYCNFFGSTFLEFLPEPYQGIHLVTSSEIQFQRNYSGNYVRYFFGSSLSNSIRISIGNSTYNLFRNASGNYFKIGLKISS